MSNYEYLLSDINKINGIGTKTAKLFRKKNINTIFDLLWNLPRDIIDRSDLRKINQLQLRLLIRILQRRRRNLQHLNQSKEIKIKLAI